MVATSAMLADKHHQRARTSSHLVIRVQQLETRCAEMQKEMDDLTLERSRLLGYVRASATQISQSGVRLVGLSSDHIQLVRSYASALSSGACAGDSWSGNLEQDGKKRMLFLEQELTAIKERLQRDKTIDVKILPWPQLAEDTRSHGHLGRQGCNSPQN
mmetsp:Transcript_32710/g.101237  ORF Transcript_32710/g.101237 Transcript_32710/m.101237 type:complete len:159 (+) Transcript_32710:776-1252(+)